MKQIVKFSRDLYFETRIRKPSRQIRQSQFYSVMVIMENMWCEIRFQICYGSPSGGIIRAVPDTVQKVPGLAPVLIFEKKSLILDIYFKEGKGNKKQREIFHT